MIDINPNVVELHITYRCNIFCANCSNLVTQVADLRGEWDMALEDIRAFVDQTKTAGKAWEMITLHGGEPCLHPQFQDVVDILKTCGAKVIWLLSNWSTPEIQRRCEGSGLPIGKAEKHADDISRQYVTVNSAPSDYGDRWELGCFQPRTCGMGCNRLGWFACSPIAAAARIVPDIVPAKSWMDTEALQAQLVTHCHRCGFSRPNRDTRRASLQVTSPWWEQYIGKERE